METIIHESFGISKVSARWVPRNLSMQDRQKRVASGQELLDVQCQSNTLVLYQEMKLGFSTGTQILKNSHFNGSALAHPN